MSTSRSIDSRVERIRAVFFDLDGTLTDYEASVDYAMSRIWERIKGMCDLTLEQFLKAQWDFLAEMEQKEANGLIPRSFLKDRGRRMAEFLKRLDAGLADRFDDVGALYTRLRRECVKPFPGVVDVLRRLGESFLLGVITEGDGAVQRDQMRRGGLEGYFDQVVISDEVGLHKPDTALFLKACQLASVAPSEAALVGDRVDWDIRPAKAIGMLTFLSRQQRHYRANEPGEEVADFVIGDIRELERLLSGRQLI